MLSRGLVFLLVSFAGAAHVCPNDIIHGSSVTTASEIAPVNGKISHQSATAVSAVSSRSNKQNKKLKCNSHEVRLPDSVKEAYKKWDSDFIIWKSSEYSPLMCQRVQVSESVALNAVLGDFNKDAVIDTVVVGHNKTHEFLVAAVSQRDSRYQVIPLCSSEINSTLVLKEAEGCILLGITGDADFGLKSFPRLALYKWISAGTNVDVFNGYSDSYVFNLHSEAFLVGHIDQAFIRLNGPYQTKSGQIVTDPFDAFRLGWWNLRQGKGAAWEDINNSEFKFRLWEIHSIADDSRDFSGIKW